MALKKKKKKLQGRPCLTGHSKNYCGFRQMKVVWTFKAFKIEMMALMVSDVSKNVDFDWVRALSGQ